MAAMSGDAERGGEVLRNEAPGAIVASASSSVAWTSTMVASGSSRNDASMIVASESSWGRFSGGIGMSPEELSPANGVPTPGRPGFLGTGFLSDCAESLMLSFQKLPQARRREHPDGQAAARPRVGTPWKSIYLAMLSERFSNADPARNRTTTCIWSVAESGCPCLLCDQV